MNSTGILFLVCIAGVFTATIGKSESKKEINPDCLREYGIEPESLHVDSRPFTEGEIYCIAACIYRDYGIMRANGTIDTDVADTYFTESDTKEREIFYAVYNECKNDHIACKLVQCMFKELKNHLGNSSGSINVSKRLLSGTGLIEFA